MCLIAKCDDSFRRKNLLSSTHIQIRILIFHTFLKSVLKVSKLSKSHEIESTSKWFGQRHNFLTCYVQNQYIQIQIHYRSRSIERLNFWASSKNCTDSSRFTVGKKITETSAIAKTTSEASYKRHLICQFFKLFHAN